MGLVVFRPLLPGSWISLHSCGALRPTGLAHRCILVLVVFCGNGENGGGQPVVRCRISLGCHLFAPLGNGET
ncbi:hypothetical protein MG293_001271 [Ovis ammon polii]|uniref:Uncharacterized protein n=1 Tax=Ovis ammon polii TaxID=230172 RepID=A0AAD4UPB9_OVIAM|nr:hypothetical protein MG293_001271 [Ovis ammon polii]KAI4579606.1 hypothetical protein MJT46_000974 [Ovis ammon polii x Ovis aries]